MIHHQDEKSLKRLLGGKIPPEVEEEYKLRIAMFHADGNSGPLGTIGLIDLIRHLGLKPPRAEEKPQPVDWRQYPHDGSVRVEAYFFGQWKPGRYYGFVENGTLAVRLDDDPRMKECRRDIVRLSTKPVRPDLDDDLPRARIALLDKLPEMPPTGAAPQEPPPVEPPVALEEDEDGGEIDEEESPPVGESRPLTFVKAKSWDAVEAATPVLVEVDGDLKLGNFIRLTEDGNLLVDLEGDETVTVHPDKATLAGAL